uniref:Wall-associated receptor kinase galacturonan-binding domain-containing protein n=1 Tax=Aegilops tauschii subsp. strangulata TaxID=200361 RepID=A0A453MV61_AEGTS
SEGLVNVKYSLYDEDHLSVRVPKDPGLYVASGGVVLQQWAVANLTCHEAQENRTGYACVSMNSICLGVNPQQEYVGYRCKCLAGFDGNPYIADGCKGTYTQHHAASSTVVHILNHTNMQNF